MGYTIKHSQINKKITRVSRPSQARDLTSILSSNSWKGSRCFILAGGPSLEDFNFDAIKNELTIGINKAFMSYPCTINYSMDPKFYTHISSMEQWEDFKGIKVFLPTNSRKVTFDPSIYTLERTYRKTISFDLSKGIYGGYNSGIGALMLAICLGANPIYLLGFDMKVDYQNRKTHWHRGYPKQGMLDFDKKLEKFKKEFERLAPVIESLGIDVINLNEGSSLRCFLKESVKNVLRNTSDKFMSKLKHIKKKEEIGYSLSKLGTVNIKIISSPEDLEKEKEIKKKKEKKKEKVKK